MTNLPQIFFNNSELYENKTLFGFKRDDNWEHLSWKNTKDLVLNISSALHEIGVKKNDKISIIADNSYKWCAVDLATISFSSILETKRSIILDFTSLFDQRFKSSLNV